MNDRMPYMDDPDAITTAASANDAHAVLYLIKRGDDVNARDDQGNSALLYAAENGSLFIVKLLCRYGADVDIANTDGDRAIDVAKYRRNDDVVAFLRARQALEKDGPSALEQQWDSIYSAFDSANAARRLISLIHDSPKKDSFD